MQARGQLGPSPIGVVYNTSMARPDAALALAALYVFGSKGEARVGSICVSGAGLETAIYCDLVGRFYVPAARNSNAALPVGLAAVNPLPPDAAMVKPAVNRKKDNGDDQYTRSIRRLTDTAAADAVLRNGVTFNAESVVVLSAPATWLARSLDLQGAPDLYRARVKRLVIVDAGALQADAVALRKVIAQWPSPIDYVGAEVGDALRFPGANLEKAFAWAPAHPVVDAYRAYRSMPYDAPLYDLAALDYAVHPDSGFFDVSDPGTLSVAADGSLKFSAGSGNARKLTVDPAKKSEALTALVAAASTKPVPPAGRGRGGL